ncbi:MAG: four-carbon acid sugar kinase family protein [Novosphingobium sp.]
MKQPAITCIGIVADDLTSATDGAAPFLPKGYAPLIAQGVAGALQSALVAVDTNSRALIESEAAQAVASAISSMRDRPILLKTVDSTLRGHIRSEIAAAFQASGRRRLVVAPAFPDVGRLTRGGIQFVHGTPVSDSDYGSDPVHPARTSHIGDLIEPSLGSPRVLSADASQGAFEQAASTPVIVLDADSQAMLNRQVARIPDPQDTLWVGSPGLAIALASMMPADLHDSSTDRMPHRRALVVAGSANRVTHAQCLTLEDAGIPVIENLAEAPRDFPIICLRAPMHRQNDSASVLDSIAAHSAAALALKDYDVVIATGGETISAILERLGISHFRLTRELEPGFPVGLAELPDGALLTVALKAGGFGSPITLLDAALALTPIVDLAR